MKLHLILSLWIVVVLSCVINVLNTKAQRSVEFKITAADESGVEVTMTAGVDDRATDSLDMKLGEQFLPGHPPAPSPIHAALLVENMLSYKNFRRIPDTNKFSLEYTINVNDYSERKSPFFFKWEYPFPKYMDSAKIMDRLGGTIYSFALDDTRKSIMITNEGLRNYNLVIWYSLPPVNVEEDSENQEENTRVRFTNESIHLHSTIPVRTSVYDAMSHLIKRNTNLITDDIIDTSALSNGVYFMVCMQNDGTIQSKKIIIVR